MAQPQPAGASGRCGAGWGTRGGDEAGPAGAFGAHQMGGQLPEGVLGHVHVVPERAVVAGLHAARGQDGAQALALRDPHELRRGELERAGGHVCDSSPPPCRVPVTPGTHARPSVVSPGCVTHRERATGPDFVEAVIRVIRDLDAGEISTYGEVAREAGYPGAARAVGHLLCGRGRRPLVAGGGGQRAARPRERGGAHPPPAGRGGGGAGRPGPLAREWLTGNNGHMDAEHLIVKEDGAVTRIVLNRPERRNALSLAVMTELIGALDGVSARSSSSKGPARASRPGTTSRR